MQMHADRFIKGSRATSPRTPLRLVLVILFLCLSTLNSKVTSFANNGTLKALYDNRQYPHAVVVGALMLVGGGMAYEALGL